MKNVVMKNYIVFAPADSLSHGAAVTEGVLFGYDYRNSLVHKL